MIQLAKDGDKKATKRSQKLTYNHKIEQLEGQFERLDLRDESTEPLQMDEYEETTRFVSEKVILNVAPKHLKNSGIPGKNSLDGETSDILDVNDNKVEEKCKIMISNRFVSTVKIRLCRSKNSVNEIKKDGFNIGSENSKVIIQHRSFEHFRARYMKQVRRLTAPRAEEAFRFWNQVAQQAH